MAHFTRTSRTPERAIAMSASPLCHRTIFTSRGGATFAPAPTRQRGVVLVIALVMLLVVTMLSVSTLSQTAQQERMSGNVRDRNMAFQAAEAAVQFCLIKAKTDAAWVTANKQVPTTPPTPETWKTAATWTGAPSLAVTMAGGTASGLNADPRCLLEAIGDGSYVITGRAVGRSDKSVVILQATFTP